MCCNLASSPASRAKESRSKLLFFDSPLSFIASPTHLCVVAAFVFPPSVWPGALLGAEGVGSLEFITAALNRRTQIVLRMVEHIFLHEQ